MRQSESEWKCVYFLGRLDDCLIFLSCLKRFPECLQNVDLLRLNVEFSFVLISAASNVFPLYLTFYSQSLFLQGFVFDHFEKWQQLYFFSFDFIFLFTALEIAQSLIMPFPSAPFSFFFWRVDRTAGGPAAPQFCTRKSRDLYQLVN